MGCSEGNKSSKEVYIYVLNKDYDATINAEWYSARKTKGGISGIELKKIYVDTFAGKGSRRHHYNWSGG